MSQYPPGGAIFPQEKKTPQSPDYTGYVEIDDAMLSDLAAEIQRSPEKKTRIRLAVWRQQSRNSGKNFLSVKPSTLSSRPNPNQNTQVNQTPAAGAAPPMDDEIPF